MNETLNISGALLVKIFGRRAAEIERFRERATAVHDTGIRQAVVGRWFFLTLSLVSAIGTALVFWAGGHLVLRGTFTVGTIVAFSAYLAELYGPLMAMTNARVDFATSMVSFERVFEVLDLPREIEDRSEVKELTTARGHVRFDDVWFRYGGAHRGPEGLAELRRFSWHGHAAHVPPAAPALAAGSHDGESREPTAPPRWTLQGVSFEIEPGRMVALVGPSGAGKTTITYLLPRLYDPAKGAIFLDGHDLRDLALDSLAQHVGMVTQETYLFHATLRENLLYARPEATQAEMEAACRTANIHEFIQSLAEGYDTLVGERGYRLSGGEKQRVAIARVLLKDPRVIILDEATSHLDSQSEAAIQEAMEAVLKGRTALVIAHRLSTVMNADRILVLDDGRIVEQGRHEELLRRGGLYASLYETQFHIQKDPGLVSA